MKCTITKEGLSQTLSTIKKIVGKVSHAYLETDKEGRTLDIKVKIPLSYLEDTLSACSFAKNIDLRISKKVNCCRIERKKGNICYG